MKRDSRLLRFKGNGSGFKENPYFPGLRNFWFVVILSVVFPLAFGGCKKEEKAPTVPVAIEPKAMEPAPAPARPGEQKAFKSPVQTQSPTFHSILTKDLNRPIPVTAFSKNDRIYLLTVWTGLHGPHEIKVLWIRPDTTVQETVRLKENVSSKTPTFTSWAYLSFSKGLLNLSPLEGKFMGTWKAQLFLDGNLLQELGFTVF
jgi:hypothetical protein